MGVIEVNNQLKQIKNDYVSWGRHHRHNFNTEQINWLINTVEQQQKKIEGLNSEPKRILIHLLQNN